MSFILDALSRARGPSGRPAAATTGDGAPTWAHRRTLWRAGGAAVVGILVLALGHTFFRTLRPAGTPVPAPGQVASAASATATASGALEIPTMPSLADKPAPPPARQAARQPARPVVQAAVPPVRAVPRFNPPTTLSQPLPQPGLGLAGAYRMPPALRTPPAPVEAPAPEARRGVTLADIKSLGDLPADVRTLVQRAKVRVLVHTPQRRHRFVIVEDRQLREGDELVAGVRLEEITDLGMVLRHKDTRVLAPSPGNR